MHARIDEVSIKDLGRKEETDEKMVTFGKGKSKRGGRREEDWRLERRGKRTKRERNQLENKISKAGKVDNLQLPEVINT